MPRVSRLATLAHIPIVIGHIPYNLKRPCDRVLRLIKGMIRNFCCWGIVAEAYEPAPVSLCFSGCFSGP